MSLGILTGVGLSGPETFIILSELDERLLTEDDQRLEQELYG